jgi:hypothetical protein
MSCQNIFANQRFAAGEQHRRHLEFGQIIQHGFALFGGQFVGICPGFGIGVAVNAFEITGARQIPDDDWLALARRPRDVHALMFGRVDLRDLPPISMRRAGGVQR